MIGTEQVLAVIPARGGSKGVPGKNIRKAGGKSLLAWTIDAAKQSKYLDRIIVSTESDSIAAVALKCGADVPFMRPVELAGDETPGIAPVMHALDLLPGYDWVVLLQPTSPLRIAADIDSCLEACVSRCAPACVTMTAIGAPELSFRIDRTGAVAPLLGWEHVTSRRQDLPEAFALNGAVYAARTNWLRATGAFMRRGVIAHMMPAERSLDIDTEADFVFFDFLTTRAK